MFSLFSILTHSSLFGFNTIEIAMTGVSSFIYAGVTLFVLYIVFEPEIKRLFKKNFLVNSVISVAKVSTLVTYLVFIIQGVL